jgi:hypothetical protein
VSESSKSVTLPKNENLCMRIKAKLPERIARVREPDPLYEKDCNVQDFRRLCFHVVQTRDTRKSNNRKTAANGESRIRQHNKLMFRYI